MPRRWAACSTRSTMPTPASPEPRRYRGALIGAGGIARQSHLPALRGAAALRARVDVVAVVHSAPGVPPVDGIPLLRDHAALRDLAPLDFIDICTPTASHLELTVWGLEQGYHVVCEKPVALTRVEAERIAAASRASGRIVMPCHQYRYNPVWLRVKEWLATGAIGRWHLAEFSVHRLAADPGRAAGGASTPWRGTSAAGRGGVLLDHGTHLVYQLLDVAGMPSAVSAWTGRLRHAGYDVEDTAALRFEYPDRLATMFFTWAGRGSRAAGLRGRAREDGVSAVVRLPVRDVRRRTRRGRRRHAIPGRYRPCGERRGARVCGGPERRDGGDPGRRVSRRLQALLFVVGSAVFAYLVARIGVGALLADARHTGWMFVPILLLYGTVCACNAGAWWLVMAGEPSRPPYWRAWAITVASFSLNFMTPLVNVGGEPFKIAAVAPWLGLRRAAGSAVIYQMLHTFGMLLSFLTAVVLGIIFLPRSPVIVALLAGAFLALAALTLLLLTGHQRGMLAGALDLLHRVPLLDRLARRLEPKRATLASMDEQITQFYHSSPRRFLLALALEYASRCLFMAEYLLIALSVGLDIGYARAYVIGGLTQLVQNVLFVVPFEAGTKEGSLYLLFQLLGLDPALGVYTAIVSRVRDLVWIGAGVGLVWLSGRRPAPAGAATP